MKVLERLEFIRIILPAMDKEFPLHEESFFFVLLYQGSPVLDTQSSRADWNPQVFDREHASLIVKNVTEPPN